jgi:glycosyltransferase involved in cell wall biosynthesis
MNILYSSESKIPDISLCIPTHNRYDTFLKHNLPKFMQNKYIKEIIIVDDATDDYDKLVLEYGLDHPKLRLYKQERNVGSFKNKVAAAAYATCEWVCLFDSDNFLDERYFIPLLAEWEKHGMNDKVVYTPTQALPNFILHDEWVQYMPKIVTKKEWNVLTNKNIPKPIFVNWFLNNGNFVFHKNFITCLQSEEYKKHNCHGVCSIYINWIAIKSGFTLKFVDDMAYDHIVHENSTYLKSKDDSEHFKDTFDWFVS